MHSDNKKCPPKQLFLAEKIMMKSDFGTFKQTVKHCSILKIQYLPSSMLNF